jgi:predicted HD phosphohydrolase
MTTADGVKSVIELLSRSTLQLNFGEELPMIEHLLQTAELLWIDCGDAEMAVAGLLHDVAWTRGSSEADHADDSAKIALELGFSARVVELIALHVTAKRYLVRSDERYWSRLSRESRATLVEQGGTLSITEVARFEASPYFGDVIRLRLADDMAKDPGRVTRSLVEFAPIIESALVSGSGPGV